MIETQLFIFLEDKQKRDRLFIEAFLSETYNIVLPDQAYIKTNGWAGIKHEEVVQQLQFNQANGGTNLILFDADEDYINRRNYLEKCLQAINVQAAIYLFPDNLNSGELETLLMRLANRQEKAFFLSCYEAYIGCIRQSTDIAAAQYRVPDYKDMFQAYHSFFRYGEPNFHDKEFWDLSNIEAQPLKDFLDTFLQK